MLNEQMNELEEEKYFRIREVSLVFLLVNLLSEKLPGPQDRKELPQIFPPNPVSPTFFRSLGEGKIFQPRPLGGPCRGQCASTVC